MKKAKTPKAGAAPPPAPLPTGVESLGAVEGFELVVAAVNPAAGDGHVALPSRDRWFGDDIIGSINWTFDQFKKL
eukprot:8731674-Pyramimonas_sp.AAC.1